MSLGRCLTLCAFVALNDSHLDGMLVHDRTIYPHHDQLIHWTYMYIYTGVERVKYLARDHNIMTHVRSYCPGLSSWSFNRLDKTPSLHWFGMILWWLKICPEGKGISLCKLNSQKYMEGITTLMINKIAKRDIFTNIRVDVTSEKF